jgi:hypothetical protein
MTNPYDWLWVRGWMGEADQAQVDQHFAQSNLPLLKFSFCELSVDMQMIPNSSIQSCENYRTGGKIGQTAVPQG